MPTRLSGLDAVLAVARLRNFRAAALEIGVSRSAISHAIAALEQEMGVRLFHRTTRSVSLTEAGEAFVGELAPAMGMIRAAIERAGAHQETPTGRLRINASVGAARRLLDPVLYEYLHRYPAITVEIVTESRKVDIVRDGFDAGVRMLESVPQDMIAVPFGGDLSFAVVGSPGYFEKRAKPHVPADLAQHRCIHDRSPSRAINDWRLSKGDEHVSFMGTGPLILDEPALMLEAAREGVGLAFLSCWNVERDLAMGSLVRVLEEWTPPSPGLALYYPGRRHLPAGLRALVNLLRESGDAANRSR
ncbi:MULTISPECIES: LysR family transcriptional regulator [unclassified Sphingomonas]|uniref:LysR family transcriptional regulator n=1 Tax=unclassified Sphingomonas TaxID=196159 RepID=UPI002269E7BA|nr:MULTISPECIES: LysR family transcriptional regulator [unclassified Sphingomonas]